MGHARPARMSRRICILYFCRTLDVVARRRRTHRAKRTRDVIRRCHPRLVSRIFSGTRLQLRSGASRLAGESPNANLETRKSLSGLKSPTRITLEPELAERDPPERRRPRNSPTRITLGHGLGKRKPLEPRKTRNSPTRVTQDADFRIVQS